MDCAFCATGKLKLRRNLTAGEIVDQVYRIREEVSAVSNVVYMGMGEPLNNYDNVLKSIRILNDKEGINLGIRHITVSTCGHVPGIIRLGNEDIHPRLAISLNAPTDTLRSELMPINKTYPLAALFEAVSDYQGKTGDRVTFEYVLIRDVNDQPEQARALTTRLRGVSCNVNLIEYNPHSGCEFAVSDKKAMERFLEILQDGGIEAIMRSKKGSSVKAACGQLGALSDKRRG
jgi:23S rRNA (adenine2503-C2)-methyltransferase